MIERSQTVPEWLRSFLEGILLHAFELSAPKRPPTAPNSAMITDWRHFKNWGPKAHM